MEAFEQGTEKFEERHRFISGDRSYLLFSHGALISQNRGWWRRQRSERLRSMQNCCL